MVTSLVGRGVMSEIINSVGGLSPLSYPGASLRVAEHHSESSSTPIAEDTVEFSTFGRALAEATEQSTFRLARIRAVRDEIARGDYETPERIRGTIDRLLDVLG